MSVSSSVPHIPWALREVALSRFPARLVTSACCFLAPGCGPDADGTSLGPQGSDQVVEGHPPCDAAGWPVLVSVSLSYQPLLVGGELSTEATFPAWKQLMFYKFTFFLFVVYTQTG